MKPIHEIISEYAAGNPTRKAAEDSFGSLSYRELDGKGSATAKRLQGLGVTAGDSVGVYVPYVKDVITGALSAWKSGGVYVPMDNAYPAERLEYILKNSGAKAILTCRNLWEKKPLNFPADNVIFLDEISDDNSPFTPCRDITPKSPAMILYTSGTTGRPKGVLHRHEFLIHIVDWMNVTEDFCMTPDSHVGLISRFTFVATVILMFGGLLNGGTLYFAPEIARNDLENLYKFLTDKKISHIFVASSLAAILAEDYDISGVNVFAAGEKLPNFRAHSDSVYLRNIYGSTEIGVVTSAKIHGDENPITIGKPGPGTKAMLADENLSPSKPGETGELLIANEYMSRQYLNLPDQTAEKWIDIDGLTWYRTGDRAALTQDGNYCILGRTDNMIKLRGFRIETGEVESQVSKAVSGIGRSDVKNIVVCLRNVSRTDYLVCYYESEKELDQNEISAVKEEAAKYLADYMIPDIFMRIAEMPRNLNGKIIRKDLPQPQMHKREITALDSETLARVVWATEDVLGITSAEPEDTFTELGGSSITAMKLAAMLRPQGIKITTAQILKLNVLRKIADRAEVDYSKLWSEEEYNAIIVDFASRGEHVQKVLPITAEQDDMLFDYILHPDRNSFSAVYMLQVDSVIQEEDLRLALDTAAEENEELRSAIVFHRTHVIQQVITDRKIPAQIVKAENLNAENLSQFRNMLYSPIDLQRDSPVRVLCAEDNEKSYLYIVTFYISFSKAQMRKYIARIMSVLEEKYPGDASIHDWREIFDGTLTGDLLHEANTHKTNTAEGSKSKLKTFARTKSNVLPEICVYSENSGPSMTFVHTGNTGSEAYYRLADRIRDKISFSVIEPFNLYHIEQAAYGIPNIAKRYVEILKRHQPKGSYILGGWCYGGMVAHEMAYQLQNAGENVKYLFMLDSHAITDTALRSMANNMFAASGREYFETSPLFADLRESGMLEAMIINSEHVYYDMANHVPSFFNGPVTYFKPDMVPAESSGNARKYWEKMMEFPAGNYRQFCNRDLFRIIHTPHEHDLMMDDPSLDIIVPEIYRALGIK
ncbi:MAG: AMP-binding protein [Synergistaceae bacterium]|nr:AMP-binding protein [Synergistaceae bacterium]